MEERKVRRADRALRPAMLLTIIENPQSRSLKFPTL